MTVPELIVELGNFRDNFGVGWDGKRPDIVGMRFGDVTIEDEARCRELAKLAAEERAKECKLDGRNCSHPHPELA